MDKKIYSFLFSTRLMAFLFLSFATAMILGTFIESKYNTDTARIWVYNAWWFEGIMLVFMINFIGNIKRYNLLRKEKWASLILHLAFIFIITGAFITRYISYEGMMPIREGAAENQIYSDKTFLTVFVAMASHLEKLEWIDLKKLARRKTLTMLDSNLLVLTLWP